MKSDEKPSSTILLSPTTNEVECRTCGSQLAVVIYVLPTSEEAAIQERSEPEVIFKVEPNFEVESEGEHVEQEATVDSEEEEEEAPKQQRKKPRKYSSGTYRAVVLEDHKDLYLKMKKKVQHVSSWPFYELMQLKDGITELHFFKPTSMSSLYMSNFDLRQQTCDICPETHKSLGAFLKHRNLHFIEDDSLTCLACNVTFPSKAFLSRHTLICKAKTTLDPFTCRYCNKKLPKFKYLRKHEADHKVSPQRQLCHLCSKVLHDSSALQSHLRKMHGINPFRCEHCPKTFADLHQTRLHLVEKHFQDKCEHRCDYCQRPFGTAGRLQSHVEMTHSGTKSVCKICKRDCSNPSTLKTHMVNAHSDLEKRKRWYCHLCGKMFLRKHGLMSHQDKHLAPEEYQFKCKVCAKPLPNKYKLTAHERKHTETPPTCKICSKTFTTKQYLKDHVNLHTVSCAL